MSVKTNKLVFVAQLQRKYTFARVTRAIEASVKALVYEKVRQERFLIIVNFSKGSDMFVCLLTGGGKSV